MKAFSPAALSVCFVVFGCASPGFSQGVDAGAPRSLAIVGGRVVVRPGLVMPKATVVVRDGKIVAVGTDVAVPAGSRVLDAKGKTVHAAFVNAGGAQGMPAAAEVPAGKGIRARWSTVRADNDATALWRTDDSLVALREAGFGTTLAVPTAGLFAGRSSVFALDPGAGEVSRGILRSSVFSHLVFQFDPGAGNPNSLMGMVAVARQAMADARRVAELRKRGESGTEELARVSAPILALESVVVGKSTLAIRANQVREIERALALSREFGIKPVIDGGGQAYLVAERLRRETAGVLLSVDMPGIETTGDRPSLTSLGDAVAAPLAAAALHVRKVPFAFATAQPARFVAQVRRAIAAGLPEDAALEAATTGAAKFLGIDRVVGRVEKGQRADLLLVSGNSAFAPESKIETVVLGGAVAVDRVPAGAAVVAPAARKLGLFPALPKPLPTSFVLRNAVVWTSGPGGILKDADVHVKDGRIVAVGRGLAVPAGTLEIDARGKHVTPGMIDCHSHTAGTGGINETGENVTAQCRIADILNPDDVNIYRQLAGGTTAANILHGSANAIGGQNAVVKWRWGSDAPGLLLDGAPQGIKFALGENPTRSNGSDSGTRYPATRLGVERLIRAKFLEARAYRNRQARAKAAGEIVPVDYQLEAIAEILEGTRLVHCHTYRADETLAMMRLAEEFGFRVATFQHILEGYKVADEMERHGAGGSTFSDWWGYKIEALDAIPWNAAMMVRRGVLSSLNSDSSELARRLNQEAAKAVSFGGLTPREALELVTIGPARQLRIDGKTGSLEPGKDADLVVWSGDPLSTASVCEKTFVDGRLLFDREADLAQRASLESEAARLAEGFGWKPSSPAPAPADVSKPFPAVPKAQPLVPSGRMTALVGGMVHPVSGAPIPDGVVAFAANGVIAAVGTRSSVALPAGTIVVDVAGKHLWPGMIDAVTTVGVNEIGSRRETQDYREVGEIAPELRVAIAVQPDAETIRVARAAGILNVGILPAGGVLPGMAAVLQLDGWSTEELSIVPGAGPVLNFPASPGGGRSLLEESDTHCDDALTAGMQTPAERRRGPVAAPPAGERLKALDAFLEDARRYRDVVRPAGPGPKVDRDPCFDAMLPVLDGLLPWWIRANTEREIREAVAWADRQGFRMIVVGGLEADLCADLLKSRGIPVLLPPTLALPRRSDSPYDDRMTLPGRLAAAGVVVALSTDGEPHNVRRLAHNAATAAAFGWNPDEALRSITLNPARILGLGDRLGSLEVGKWANVVVTDGPLLELTTRVEGAYVQGKPVDLTNRQTLLRDRWEARPRVRSAK